jgi:hypothetical protein
VFEEVDGFLRPSHDVGVENFHQVRGIFGYLSEGCDLWSTSSETPNKNGPLHYP